MRAPRRDSRLPPELLLQYPGDDYKGLCNYCDYRQAAAGETAVGPTAATGARLCSTGPGSHRFFSRFFDTHTTTGPGAGKQYATDIFARFGNHCLQRDRTKAFHLHKWKVLAARDRRLDDHRLKPNGIRSRLKAA